MNIETALKQLHSASTALNYLKTHLRFEDEIVVKDVKMYIAHARLAIDKAELLLNVGSVKGGKSLQDE